MSSCDKTAIFKTYVATGICVRSLGAGCSTCHGHCSDPPRSQLRRGAARHVDPIVTYTEVSRSSRGTRAHVHTFRPLTHSLNLRRSSTEDEEQYGTSTQSSHTPKRPTPRGGPKTRLHSIRPQTHSLNLAFSHCRQQAAQHVNPVVTYAKGVPLREGTGAHVHSNVHVFTEL